MQKLLPKMRADIKKARKYADSWFEIQILLFG